MGLAGPMDWAAANGVRTSRVKGHLGLSLSSRALATTRRACDRTRDTVLDVFGSQLYFYGVEYSDLHNA